MYMYMYIHRFTNYVVYLIQKCVSFKNCLVRNIPGTKTIYMYVHEMPSHVFRLSRLRPHSITKIDWAIWLHIFTEHAEKSSWPGKSYSKAFSLPTWLKYSPKCQNCRKNVSRGQPLGKMVNICSACMVYKLPRFDAGCQHVCEHDQYVICHTASTDCDL